jgi:hypothetical protein
MKNKKKRELLFSVTKKDLIIQWFSGSGAGGQHRNKSSNCCRIKHLDSGVMVSGTEQRSRIQNQKIAFKRLINHPEFKKWLRIKITKISCNLEEIKKEINNWVEEEMKPENLKIEYL